ncbi:ABC transporter permease [Elstera cyanobacteriorum]|uniref:Exopolysaccharide biosynthesis protein exod n=1 Tax=Elstera cyanobacteriorum TaxID=2022747 RepID=A0A255XQU6_9PROT|nr:exopolysaccharide biosynthesis protein [Elstera cyanobacteriorum]OYQ19339.1 hypothetical protein CHR90_07875 [Elstera cyanobacteriorum]GFZ90721.1 ABC transporter permease [Elstera cyanobacteriorum]
MSTEPPVEAASALLRRLIAEHPYERISLDDLLHGVGHRAFGLLLLLLALPNSIPLPSPPGLSTIFGLPMAIFAAQLMLGQKEPWLPAFLRKKTLPRDEILKFLDRAQPYLTKVERRLKPRASSFVGPAAERVAGLIILGLAIVLSMPIIFGNFLPAFAVLLMALAILARDGAMMVAGWVVSVIAVAVVGLVIYVGIEAVKLALFSLFS